MNGLCHIMPQVGACCGLLPLCHISCHSNGMWHYVAWYGKGRYQQTVIIYFKDVGPLLPKFKKSNASSSKISKICRKMIILLLLLLHVLLYIIIYIDF
jgi:hypothetical protein